ncbi:hypothetical protein SEA_LEVIATHAN_8 [Mycobacterium Phage Leviathan]|uniref:Uncharacterized protein n=2 Tax=Turbidovirus turbido TaxID=1993865 RepID=A0A8T8JC81_9CAUD|nr:hypothetical protein SEA_SMEAGAN_8 [Mycobacterium phage Smeagan]QWS69738.1 hypothetical protein SEA_LEVIATHAN_8 [Mycobacterium Phage Leviathan]
MLFETMIQVVTANAGTMEVYYLMASDYDLDTQAGRDAAVAAIESLADNPDVQVYSIALNVIDTPQRPNGEVVKRQRMAQATTPGDYTPFWDLLGPPVS